MDELIIEEKRYVSSKRAAQMTGYAKDYVGQLCREGRVPARLVGRNWYVLESAIQDHRFGTEDIRSKPQESLQEAVSKLTDTWQSPRYQAIAAEKLPAVKRLQHIESEKEVEQEAPGAPEHLRDAWQSWFDHIAGQEGPAATSKNEEETAIEEMMAEEAPREVKTEEGEVKVAIKAVYHPELKPPHRSEAQKREEMPIEEEEVEEAPVTNTGSRSSVMRYVQVAGVCMAVLSIAAAALGSGYLDTFVLSYTPDSLLAGVSMYNK